MSETLETLKAAAAAVVAASSAADPAELARGLGDDGLLATLRVVSDARRALDVVAAGLSSEIDRRSVRDLGYDGLAQRSGFRSSVSLIQNITGQSASDVRRVTAAGNDLALVGSAAGSEEAMGGLGGRRRERPG